MILRARARAITFRRSVSSLTPLGSAFNSTPLKSSLFPASLRDRTNRRSRRSSKPTGLFGIDELTRPEGFDELRRQCADRSAKLVAEACAPGPPQRTRLVSRVFDELSDELCRVADLSEFVRLAHPDREMATAAEAACIEVSGLVERLNTDIRLYEALAGNKLPPGHAEETDVDRHVAKLFLLDFEQCGIHLPEADRREVVELNDAILQLGQRFAYNAHRPRVVKKLDLPTKLRHHFSLDGDNVVVNGLQVDTPNHLAREASYRIYYGEDAGQEQLLVDILSMRHRMAELCGYETFGHRAMAESLGADPDSVGEFLLGLSADLRAIVGPDYAAMSKMKSDTGSSSRLEVWDVPYFSSIARADAFDGDPAKVAEYFSLGVCMEGLDRLFDRLFGVRLRVEDPAPGELWHPDVYKVAVVEADSGAHLGTIYCDFFTRSGKPNQDCHFTIRGGRAVDSDGSYQNPVVVLMLNLPSPGWTRPTLLSASMLDNLFHEMGHAMHSMLARTKYQHVTGTRCSTDFAEVPSTLLEFFAGDARVLHDIGCHYKTGQALPLAVLERFAASRKLFAGADAQTQLCYALLDQRLHAGPQQQLARAGTTAVLRDVHATHHCLELPAETAWQHRFSHLVGYGARYYSYLMARSVASKIWRQFFRENPFDGENGARYRRDCLAHGGGKPSRQLVADMLGKPVGHEELCNALVAEIEESRLKS